MHVLVWVVVPEITVVVSGPSSTRVSLLAFLYRQVGTFRNTFVPSAVLASAKAVSSIIANGSVPVGAVHRGSRVRWTWPIIFRRRERAVRSFCIRDIGARESQGCKSFRDRLRDGSGHRGSTVSTQKEGCVRSVGVSAACFGWKGGHGNRCCGVSNSGRCSACFC